MEGVGLSAVKISRLPGFSTVGILNWDFVLGGMVWEVLDRAGLAGLRASEKGDGQPASEGPLYKQRGRIGSVDSD